MGRTVYEFNLGDSVSWYGNNSKTTLLTGEVKLINDKLGLLFVRHLYDGNYFLKEIHGSEVIEHNPYQENNKENLKDLKFDEINKPKHYNSTKYETKEIIKDILSNYKDTTPYTQYCIGNLLKYISRGPLKENLLKDLKKGMFYLEETIKEIEGEIDE